MVISTHAPLAGRDRLWMALSITLTVFQPTRPLRGATLKAAGDGGYKEFQPTRPLRGATFLDFAVAKVSTDFNPRAPCGARRFRYS